MNNLSCQGYMIEFVNKLTTLMKMKLLKTLKEMQEE